MNGVDLSLGQYVEHPRFGRGRIDEIRGESLGIRFEGSVANRYLLAEYFGGKWDEYVAAGMPIERRVLASSGAHHRNGPSRSREAPPRRTRGTLHDYSTRREIPLRKEIIRDTIPEEGTGFLGGQSGALKSFTAVELSMCLMTGQPFAGRKVVRTGGVLFCAFEGAGTIEGRIAARRSKLDDPEAVLPIRVIDDFGVVHSDRDYAEFSVLVDRAQAEMRKVHGVDLVAIIMDTVSAAGMIAEDKENDQGAWQRIFDRLNPISKRINAPIILIHHYGKDKAAGLRGSSNNRAQGEFVMAVTCDRDEITGETTDHMLALTKTRNGIEGPMARIEKEQVQIGCHDDGDPITSLVLRFDTGKKAAKAEELPSLATCRLIQKEIDTGWKSGRPLSTSPQTKDTGRYAYRHLAKTFNLSFGAAQKLIRSWIDAEIVAMDTVDRKTKQRGLKVLEWL